LDDDAADLLGLPVYPPPYLYSANQDTSSGVNFAVGGSGVTYDNGEVNLGAQVDNFELFLRTDPYSKVALANSLTLVSVIGNDYLHFTGKTSAVSLDHASWLSMHLSTLTPKRPRIHSFKMTNSIDHAVTNFISREAVNKTASVDKKFKKIAQKKVTENHT